MDVDGWKLSSALSEAEQGQLAALLNEYRDVFAFNNADITGYKGVEGPFEIPLVDEEPTFEKQRRLSPKNQQLIDEYYTELLELDFIELADETDPRHGRYATNTTVAAKKDAETGEWTDARICQDSRRPNEKCVRDQRVMHRVDELLQRASSCRYFTAIDLRKGFHQIPVKPEHRVHTSFLWKGKIYQWKVIQ